MSSSYPESSSNDGASGHLLVSATVPQQTTRLPSPSEIRGRTLAGSIAFVLGALVIAWAVHASLNQVRLTVDGQTTTGTMVDYASDTACQNDDRGPCAEVYHETFQFSVNGKAYRVNSNTLPALRQTAEIDFLPSDPSVNRLSRDGREDLVVDLFLVAGGVALAGYGAYYVIRATRPNV